MLIIKQAGLHIIAIPAIILVSADTDFITFAIRRTF
jgi:hypothetical protein